MSWITKVYAFQGPKLQWLTNSLDDKLAIFIMGDYGFSTSAPAVDATKDKLATVKLNGGDSITLVVDDDKRYYSDNTGEIILDIFFVP